MITALVFTIVLNNAEAEPFAYYYPNESACSSALDRADYNTTGKYSVEVECHSLPSAGEVVAPSTGWIVLGVGLVANTTQIIDNPRTLGAAPDVASCLNTMKRLKETRVYGKDTVTICVPKA